MIGMGRGQLKALSVGSSGSGRDTGPKGRGRNRAAGSRPASTLRIAGGLLRGRRLPVTRGVRPSSSRLREALFSIWQGRVGSCRFLDLFAGSGAVGFEAISRGASLAVLVESASRVFNNLKASAQKLAPDSTRLVRATLPGGLDRLMGERFDLIFADPPYAYQQLDALLDRATPLLKSGGEMALEHSIKVEVTVPAPWRLRERRCYGDSCLSFFRLDGELET